jgi:hypothetical protein
VFPGAQDRSMSDWRQLLIFNRMPPIPQSIIIRF